MATPKTEADRALADFWRSYKDAGQGGFRYALKNPRDVLRAMIAIRELPTIYPPQLSDTPDGRAIGRVLHQKGPGGLPARWWSFAALPVPERPADSLKSPQAKRLRYTLRQAAAANITCRPVEPSERAALVEEANERDRNHSNPTYRVENPQNEALLDHDLWILAEDDTGEPLLLAVVAVDGEFAVLRYFRTLGDSEKHSLSRYVAHYAIVEALSERGVRWLVDNEPPASQTNGVRLFQRIIGFRYVRIHRPGRRYRKVLESDDKDSDNLASRG